MFTSITPTYAVQLSGRGWRTAPFIRVASPLEANLILLPTARGYCCVVGLDTLFASASFKSSVLEALPPTTRARIDDLVFVASHTHNAPALDPS